MTRTTLRLAAVSAVAVLAVGAGASLAQAAEATASAPAAVSSAPALTGAQARALLADPAVSAELNARDTTSLRAVATELPPRSRPAGPSAVPPRPCSTC
jgi:hypothetical protein